MGVHTVCAQFTLRVLSSVYICVLICPICVLICPICVLICEYCHRSTSITSGSHKRVSLLLSTGSRKNMRMYFLLCTRSNLQTPTHTHSNTPPTLSHTHTHIHTHTHTHTHTHKLTNKHKGSTESQGPARQSSSLPLSLSPSPSLSLSLSLSRTSSHTSTRAAPKVKSQHDSHGDGGRREQPMLRRRGLREA